MTIKSSFIHMPVVSGFEMNKPYVIAQLRYLLLSGTVQTGINVDQMTAVSQFLSSLSDINTHTTGILRPQFTYRA